MLSSSRSTSSITFGAYFTIAKIWYSSEEPFTLLKCIMVHEDKIWDTPTDIMITMCRWVSITIIQQLTCHFLLPPKFGKVYSPSFLGFIVSLAVSTREYSASLTGWFMPHSIHAKKCSMNTKKNVFCLFKNYEKMYAMRLWVVLKVFNHWSHIMTEQLPGTLLLFPATYVVKICCKYPLKALLKNLSNCHKPMETFASTNPRKPPPI